MKIAISDFVRRQTRESSFTHCVLYDHILLARVYDNFGRAKKGYRDGVILVPVEPDGFYSGVTVLKDGDQLSGNYVARQEGEQPRRNVRVVGKSKQPAKRVDIVLYRKDVLAENNENSCEDADWEIVSINGAPTDEEMPIMPMTLLHNHFKSSGGTATNMTNDELMEQLKVSFEYWKDKALVEEKTKWR